MFPLRWGFVVSVSVSGLVPEKRQLRNDDGVRGPVGSGPPNSDVFFGSKLWSVTPGSDLEVRAISPSHPHPVPSRPVASSIARSWSRISKTRQGRDKDRIV
jgi:hypothetical protein